MALAIFALFIVQAVILFIWFWWTIWLTTRAAKLMGEGWTRGKVLRRVSLSMVLSVHRGEGKLGDGEGYGEALPLSASVHPMHHQY